MNTTQIKAASEHAKWTFETFGLPNEIQMVRIARDFAKSNGLDGELTYMVMLQVCGKLGKI